MRRDFHHSCDRDHKWSEKQTKYSIIVVTNKRQSMSHTKTGNKSSIKSQKKIRETQKTELENQCLQSSLGTQESLQLKG